MFLVGKGKRGKVKKKLLFLLFMILFAFLTISCKTKTTVESPLPSPEDKSIEKTNDLTGLWKSSEDEEMQMEAIIEDETIKVRWIANDGQTKVLYWVGSYIAPTESVSEYQWSSVRDKERTATAFLCSLDDTKLFQYSNGNLSYEIPSSKSKETISLIRE